MNFKSLEVIPNFYSTFDLKAPFLSSLGYSSSENKRKVGIQVEVAYVMFEFLFKWGSGPNY